MENITKLAIIDNVMWSCFMGGNTYLGIYLAMESNKLKKENDEKVKISSEKKNN